MTSLTHSLTHRPLVLTPPRETSFGVAVLGMGCFWGAERLFWRLAPMPYNTMVGYAGGVTDNPSYKQVCSGTTGHAEVVGLVYDPAIHSYEQLLTLFFENHDPTQGMRQGNDVGSQYRSIVLTTTAEQARVAHAMRTEFGVSLKANGYPPITTEIAPLQHFWLAESEHQQYLEKNPNGYCGLRGTGVCVIS
jgi:peptide-methionine (S)-S-oxide reductase